MQSSNNETFLERCEIMKINCGIYKNWMASEQIGSFKIIPKVSSN